MIGTVNGVSGEFRQAALDEPLNVQVGDTAAVIGNQVVISRNGSVIATRDIVGIFSPVPLGAVQDETITSVMFFWRTPVPGQSVVLLDVTENVTTGAITFKYSDGTAVEYPTWTAVGNQLGVMDQQPDLAQQILAYKSYVNSPDGTNKTTMIDTNVTINFAAGTPIALIEP